MSAGKLVLVDGSAMIYRAFFAIPPHFTTKAGLHTNAIYGFATMFKKLMAGRSPTHGAVVFDAPGPTFREQKFAAYKAQRPPMPDEMREQLAHIDALVEAWRFPLLRLPGWEADDVIGTLARAGERAGHEVVIVSGDKDFAQLVGGKVRMQDTLRDVTYDSELVRKKWGVQPEQMIDLLALMGDASDNIPGVPGIGQKGATLLLAEHGTLDGIYARLDHLAARHQKALIAGRDSAFLSRDLATIDTAAPVSVVVDDLLLPEVEPESLNSVYRTLEFYSLLTESDAQETRAGTVDDDGVAVTIAHTPDSAHEALHALLGKSPAQPVSITALFDGTPVTGDLVALAVAVATDAALVVPTTDAHLRVLVPFLQDPAQPKVMHDEKELRVLLLRQGIALRGVVFDTMLASFLIDPTKIIPHGFDALAKEYLQRTVRARKDVLVTTEKGAAPHTLQTLWDKDAGMVAAYAGHLATTTAALLPVLSARLDEAGLARHLADIDLPLSDVLARMQLVGIAVDPQDLAALGVELRARLADLVTTIHGLAGRTFNVGSPKQLGEVLFDELKLPITKRTKSGYSTDASVLEKLADDHEIARHLLEYRRIDKLINTYTDVLVAAINPATGRIHATFQQAVGATGRLITTDPDLQRTPVRGAEGRRIRNAFVAQRLGGEDTAILSADWSQIELRLLAHISGDPLLVDSFLHGADVHRRTAARIYGKSEAEVTSAERNVGKTVNFATIYGQGATALAQILRIHRKEAQRAIDEYFTAYAGVRAWLDETIAKASETGFATTLFGRRRIIPELRSKSPMDRGFGERVAANTPIQGSAADICKLAMLRIDARLQREAPRTRMLLQIHDELVFESPLDEVEDVRALVRHEMEHVVPLRVPLVAEVGVGKSWGEAH